MYMWSYSKRLAYTMSILFAKESEKRRQSTSEILESNLRKHYSNTVSSHGLRREEAITVTHSVDSF